MQGRQFKLGIEGEAAEKVSTGDSAVQSAVPTISKKVTGNVGPEDGDQVVQCKFCQTKFSIPKDRFSGMQEPKFHCCCCDNIFKIDLENYQKLSTETCQSQVVASSAKEEAVQGSLSCQSEVSKEDTGLSSFQKVEKPVANDSFGFASNLKIKQTAKVKTTLANSEPSVPAKPEVKNSVKLQNDVKQSFSPRNYASGFVFSNNQTEEENAGKKESSLPDFSVLRFKLPAMPSFSFVSPGFKSLKDKILVFKQSYKKPQLQVAKPKVSVRSPLQGYRYSFSRLALLFLPAVLTLLFLGLLAGFIVKNPDYFQGFFLSSDARQVPPLGVGTRKVKLERQVLENGKVVNVIKGEVYNNSSQPVSDMVVEGALFDAQGKVITAQQFSLADSLDQVKLVNLDLEEINQLQTLQRTSVLTKGSVQNFLFVLLDANVSGKTYFSSRVYAVGSV